MLDLLVCQLCTNHVGRLFLRVCDSLEVAQYHINDLSNDSSNGQKNLNETMLQFFRQTMMMFLSLAFLFSIRKISLSSLKRKDTIDIS